MLSANSGADQAQEINLSRGSGRNRNAHQQNASTLPAVGRRGVSNDVHGMSAGKGKMVGLKGPGATFGGTMDQVPVNLTINEKLAMFRNSGR